MLDQSFFAHAATIKTHTTRQPQSGYITEHSSSLGFLSSGLLRTICMAAGNSNPLRPSRFFRLAHCPKLVRSVLRISAKLFAQKLRSVHKAMVEHYSGGLHPRKLSRKGSFSGHVSQSKSSSVSGFPSSPGVCAREPYGMNNRFFLDINFFVYSFDTLRSFQLLAVS